MIKTFTEWLKTADKNETELFRKLAEDILNDEDFPNAPMKAPNRRYLRLEANYCGHYQLLAFDDLWTWYEEKCMPKRPKDTHKTAEQIRQEERQRIVDQLTLWAMENRTGICDGFCDALIEELEQIAIGKEVR